MNERNHLAAHVGREVEFQALGRSWKTSRLERGIWRKFLDEYAAKVLPDPVAVAMQFLDKLPKDAPYIEAAATAIVRDGLDRKCAGLTPSNPNVLGLLNDPDGSSYLLMLLLQKHQPGVTHDEAYDVAMAVGIEEVARVTLEAQGAIPAPKDEAPTASRSPPTDPNGETSAPSGQKSTASSPANAG